jgi:osmotically inducible protein OsmC
MSSDVQGKEYGKMAEVKRQATGSWSGDLKGGKGSASTESGALADVVMTYPSRFENSGGSNPEELVAAAHASCFSMALANELSQQGHVPEMIETRATITLDLGRLKITRIHLETQGRVPGIDDATFLSVAEQAKDNCPVSVLLKPGLEGLTLEARKV